MLLPAKLIEVHKSHRLTAAGDSEV